MRITQDLVNRTQDLLRSYECLLNDNSNIGGQLRVKLATAELCLFKIASLMQAEVDNDKL